MINTTESRALLLKTDSLGRVRTPREQRELILDSFEHSGMSGQAFAAHVGVKYPTFASWVQKRKKKSNLPKEKLQEIELFEGVSNASKASASSALEVQTPEGFILRISHSDQLGLAQAFLTNLGAAKRC